MLFQYSAKILSVDVLRAKAQCIDHAAAASAAAKLLQSCLTQWDPVDGSPPGSPVPGIFQARVLGWVAVSFSSVDHGENAILLAPHHWTIYQLGAFNWQIPIQTGFNIIDIYWISTSLAAQMVKKMPAMQTWVWSLGWEHPLDNGMATYSSILAWRIPWTEELGRLQSMGLQGVRHNWVTNTHTHTHTHTGSHIQKFWVK